MSDILSERLPNELLLQIALNLSYVDLKRLRWVAPALFRGIIDKDPKLDGKLFRRVPTNEPVDPNEVVSFHPVFLAALSIFFPSAAARDPSEGLKDRTRSRKVSRRWYLIEDSLARWGCEQITNPPTTEVHIHQRLGKGNRERTLTEPGGVTVKSIIDFVVEEFSNKEGKESSGILPYLDKEHNGSCSSFGLKVTKNHQQRSTRNKTSQEADELIVADLASDRAKVGLHLARIKPVIQMGNENVDVLYALFGLDGFKFT